MGKFLRGFWYYLNAYLARRAVSNLVEGWTPKDKPMPNEPLARYIYSNRDFGAERVKRRAFMPRKKAETDRLETSIFRVFGLSSEDVIELSKLARQDKQAKAAAHHRVKHIHESSLELEADNTPERHANIIGWPEEKFEQLDRAEKLASKSSLERYDNPT